MHEEEDRGYGGSPLGPGSPGPDPGRQEATTMKHHIKLWARLFMTNLEDKKWYESEADLLAALEGIYEEGLRDGRAGAYPEMVAARIQGDRSRRSSDPVQVDPGRGSGPAHAGPDGDDGGRASGGLPEGALSGPDFDL